MHDFLLSIDFIYLKKIGIAKQDRTRVQKLRMVITYNKKRHHATLLIVIFTLFLMIIFKNPIAVAAKISLNTATNAFFFFIRNATYAFNL